MFSGERDECRVVSVVDGYDDANLWQPGYRHGLVLALRGSDVNMCHPSMQQRNLSRFYVNSRAICILLME